MVDLLVWCPVEEEEEDDDDDEGDVLRFTSPCPLKCGEEVGGTAREILEMNMNKHVRYAHT